MKAIKTKLQEQNPDRVATFETKANTLAKQIVSNFKNFDFYTGEAMNPEGMVALLNYRVGQSRTSILTGETDRTAFPPTRRMASPVCTPLPTPD